MFLFTIELPVFVSSCQSLWFCF